MTEKLKVYVWKPFPSFGPWVYEIAPAGAKSPWEARGIVADGEAPSREAATALGLAKLEELLTAELERQDPPTVDALSEIRWDEGFEAAHEWWLQSYAPGGAGDPPRNPYAT